MYFFIQFTASKISSWLLAPVDSIIGLLNWHINSINGLFVISDEDILYTSINSFKNTAESISNGVLINSISHLSQYVFNSSYSDFQNLSYF